MEEVVRSILAQQTTILRSMRKQQRTLLTSMKKQQAALFRSMSKQQTAMSEQQTGLLTSINEQLAKLNSSNFLRNKVEVEDLMEEEKQKVTKIKEVTRDSYVQQMQEFPSSRSEEKKYRLHIVGEVFHETIHENGRSKLNVIKGRPLPPIEVILKHGDDLVPATHHLASMRVELVVLNANCHIEEFTEWSHEEFEGNLMPVSKTSSNRMTVERGKFSLDGGRKVYTGASIKESSWKQKVRLGVMVHDGGVKERVLEGVSSNEFYVIHDRRREATCANKDSKRQATGNSEQNSNGKRVNNDTTLQPRTPYSQFSGHAQNPQKFGQHAKGEQPSHARNACSTQNFPTAPIGNIGGAIIPPRAYAPNPNAASVQTKLDDNHDISFQGYWQHDKPDDNQGHVDPSSRNLMMGVNPVHENLQGLQTQLGQFGDMVRDNDAADKGKAPMSESPGESSDSMLYAAIDEPIFSVTVDDPSSFPEPSLVPLWVDEMRWVDE